MTEEFIVAYDGSKSNIRSIVDYFYYRQKDQCLIYDSLVLQKVNGLKHFLAEKRDKKGGNPRIIVLIDANEKDFIDVIYKLNDIEINEHRVNYVVYNVDYCAETIKRLNVIDNFLTGRASFIYLIGNEDFEGNSISEDKLEVLLFNVLFMVSHGAFTLLNDRDPFFWQQNKRDDKSHLTVLNPLHSITNLSGDIFQKLIDEIENEKHKWNQDKVSLTVDIRNSVYADLIFEKDKNILCCEPLQLNMIPYNIFVEDSGDENILFTHISKYMESAEAAILDYKKRGIKGYRVLFYNREEKENEKLETSIRENTFGKYLNTDQLEYKKICMAVDEYLKCCALSLTEKTSNIPELDISDILSDIKKEYHPKLLRKAMEIRFWKSCKNKKKLALASSLLAVILGLFAFYFIYFRLGIMSLDESMAVSFPTAGIISGIMAYRYYKNKLNILLLAYSKIHKEIISYVNTQLKNKFDEYESKWFLFIKKIYQKRVIKNTYIRLANIKNKLASFNDIVCNWLVERRKLNKVMDNSTYLYKDNESYRFDIKTEIDEMLSEIRKHLIIRLKNACFRKENLNFAVLETLDNNLFQSYAKMLANNSKRIGDRVNNQFEAGLAGKIKIMKEDRIPLSREFLVTDGITKPELRYSFLVKSKSLALKVDMEGESYDPIIEIDDIDNSCTIGYIYNVFNADAVKFK